MTLATVSTYTPEEYLEREEKAEVRSEFIDGTIIEMAGATANHNHLTGKFHARLLLALDDTDSCVFMSDMRLWLPKHKIYTYPDVMAVVQSPQFTDARETALTNPCLIVEVLSTSTEDYDKTDKFRRYRSIPEFEEYILIDQTTYRVEQQTKVAHNQWLLTEWTGETATIQLRSVECAIALQDLYRKVKFGT